VIRLRKWSAVILGMIAFYFMKSFKKVSAQHIRPPGALPEDEFLATCMRCGQCAQVCPYNSILIADGTSGLSIGTPYIKARNKPCFLCKDLYCIKTCPSKALSHIEQENIAMGTAKIDIDNCNAWLGDECKMCYLSCPHMDEAIQLIDYKKPIVSSENCVGCGICEYVCVNQTASIVVSAHYST